MALARLRNAPSEKGVRKRRRAPRRLNEPGHGVEDLAGDAGRIS
jgi:hypothetical protein